MVSFSSSQQFGHLLSAYLDRLGLASVSLCLSNFEDVLNWFQEFGKGIGVTHNARWATSLNTNH